MSAGLDLAVERGAALPVGRRVHQEPAILLCLATSIIALTLAGETTLLDRSNVAVIAAGAPYRLEKKSPTIALVTLRILPLARKRACTDYGPGVTEDGLVELLGTFDRNRGPVALQTLVDAAERRGRFFGEHAVGQGLLVAAARADNARALGRGERPRFRLAGGRIGLTDWALDGELVRLEREIQQLGERYREASRRAMLRLLQDLPHRSIGELIVLVLEHVGFSNLVSVRRPGAHGAELHLSGRLRTAAGDIRTAVVVRRDGREIGRERVTELRGALHHYGPANAAWLITTGQVLSGAREEAASPGASPLTVIDGLGLVRLCEEHSVGVIRTQVPLLLPDLDLLDGIRVS